jgi:hypothetical protein
LRFYAERLQNAQHLLDSAHARRQYDAVDPANRLVAGALERRWNEALQAVAKIEGNLAALIARRPPPLGELERQQLMALGADNERAWSHPGAKAATRKRILRTAISEIVALRMLRRGEIQGRQVCPGAPWAVKAAGLAGFTVQSRSKPPLTANSDQRVFEFQ